MRTTARKIQVAFGSGPVRPRPTTVKLIGTPKKGVALVLT